MHKVGNLMIDNCAAIFKVSNVSLYLVSQQILSPGFHECKTLDSRKLEFYTIECHGDIIPGL